MRFFKKKQKTFHETLPTSQYNMITKLYEVLKTSYNMRSVTTETLMKWKEELSPNYGSGRSIASSISNDNEIAPGSPNHARMTLINQQLWMRNNNIDDITNIETEHLEYLSKNINKRLDIDYAGLILVLNELKKRKESGEI